MTRKLLIIGLLLSSIAAAVLTKLEMHHRQWLITQKQYKSKHNFNFSDYIDQYQKWLLLPKSRRNESFLITGVKDNAASPAELEKQQHERFIANIDKLSSIQPEYHQIAGILYGDNWQQKLKEHKIRRDKETACIAVSIVVASIGGTMFVASFLLLCVRAVLRCKKSAPGESRSYEQNNIEEKTDTKPSIASVVGCIDYADKLYTDIDPAKQERSKYSAKAILQQMLHKRTTYIHAEQQPREETAEYYKDIKDKTHDIHKQIKRFGKDIELAKKKDDKAPGQMEKTLGELTEQVAAIRRYVSRQQDKSQSMQQFYDWNIIRSFALRIIRCVDNLEARIEQESDNELRDNLEQVRDELLFALESSGLERYEPRKESDYRGQEKTAEAVKEKHSANEPGLSGKIADVIKSGYKYVIDKENWKVVRAAQVKLYD